MLKNYLKYSGLWGGFVLNPFHWEFALQYLPPDEFNPNQRGFFISFGPVWIRAILDDGQW